MSDIAKLFRNFMNILGITIFGGVIIGYVLVYGFVAWFIGAAIGLIPAHILGSIFSLDFDTIDNIAGGVGVILVVGFVAYFFDYKS